MSEPKSVIWQEDLDASPWPKHSWLKILFRPRATIRAIIDSDPLRYVFLLASLAGILNALNNFYSSSAGEVMSLTTIVIVAIIVGTIFGLVSLFLNGLILTGIARLFGGEGTSEELRAVLAWSTMPKIFSLAVWLLLISFYGQDLFVLNQTSGQDNPLPFLVSAILLLIFGVWSIVLFWLCYAEVNRFSLPRALFSCAIFVVIALVLTIIVSGLLQGFV